MVFKIQNLYFKYFHNKSQIIKWKILSFHFGKQGNNSVVLQTFQPVILNLFLEKSTITTIIYNFPPLQCLSIDEWIFIIPVKYLDKMSPYITGHG